MNDPKLEIREQNTSRSDKLFSPILSNVNVQFPSREHDNSHVMARSRASSLPAHEFLIPSVERENCSLLSQRKRPSIHRLNSS